MTMIWYRLFHFPRDKHGKQHAAIVGVHDLGCVTMRAPSRTDVECMAFNKAIEICLIL